MPMPLGAASTHFNMLTVSLRMCTLQQRLASDIARSALRGSPQLNQPLPEQPFFQLSGPLLRSLLLGLIFHRT